MTRWTAGKVLAWAQDDFKKRGMPSPRFEAEVLLAEILKIKRLDIYTGFDRPLESFELEKYRNAIIRRRQGEPTAYITGRKEFWSLEFEVTPSVLIPRPDTETLVEAALKRLDDHGAALDLCTGTGCVAIAIASERPALTIDAVELSPDAAAVARRNILRHDMTARIRLLEGDLFGPVPTGTTYSVITANPPYVKAGEIPALAAEVRREPPLALDGGADGLDVVRRIMAEAAPFLVPGGWLLMEVDPRQTAEIVNTIAGDAFGTREIIPDLAGLNRVVALKKEPVDKMAVLTAAP